MILVLLMVEITSNKKTNKATNNYSCKSCAIMHLFFFLQTLAYHSADRHPPEKNPIASSLWVRWCSCTGHLHLLLCLDPGLVCVALRAPGKSGTFACSVLGCIHTRCDIYNLILPEIHLHCGRCIVHIASHNRKLTWKPEKSLKSIFSFGAFISGSY